MKVKDLNTSEPYTKIASRAKLCLEAEQKLRLRGWVDRVLVIDKATLYTYRIRGDNGSLNAWVIGGSEVYVRKFRKDGRYVITILRQDAYSLIFSLNSLDEQAAFTQALSSSGATIVGIYGILLLSEYKEMQEAIKRSLEEYESNVDQKVAYLNNSKNPKAQKPVLEIPMLSSRMTSMTWTFRNPGYESYPDVVPVVSKKMSANDSDIRKKISENPYPNLSPEISVDIYTSHEKCIADNNSCPYVLDQVDLLSKEFKFNKKKPLRRIIGEVEIGNEIGKEISRENSQSSVIPEKSLPFLETEAGIVSKMKKMFETNKDVSSTNQITTKSSDEKYQVKHSKSSQSDDSINSEFMRNDPKKQSKNSFFTEAPSMKGNLFENSCLPEIDFDKIKRDKEGKRFEETDPFNKKEKIRKRTDYYERQYQSFDDQIMRFSANDDDKDDSGVILSGLISTSESVGSITIMRKVELRRGQLLFFNMSQKKHDETTDKSVSVSQMIPLQPAVRINLEGVSTIPFFEDGSNSLVLKKKNRTVVVLQLGTKEELTTWSRALSNEIINVTPLAKRNSLKVYSTTPSLETTDTSEVSLRKERKFSWPQKSNTLSFPTENESLKVTRRISENKRLFTPLISKESKIIKETDKSSESLFKGIMKKFAIRRPSKEAYEISQSKEIENSYSGQKPGENDLSLDVIPADTRESSNSISTQVQESKKSSEELTFTTEVFLTVSENFSQDLLDEVNKVTGATFNLQEGNGSECNNMKFKLYGNNEGDVSSMKKITHSFPVGTKIFTKTTKNDQSEQQCDSSIVHVEHSKDYSHSSNAQTFCANPSSLDSKIRIKNIIKNFNALSIDAGDSLRTPTGCSINSQKPQRCEIRKIITETSVETPRNSTLLQNSEDKKTKNDAEEDKGQKFLSQKTLYLEKTKNPKIKIRTNVKAIEAIKVGRERYNHNERKSAEDMDTNDGNFVEKGTLKVTWSVLALKERYEILNTVTGNNEDTFNHSWKRNSINKRKEIRNSIRRKKAFEGESRRASIRRSTKRNVSNKLSDESLELKIPKITISDAEDVKKTLTVNNSLDSESDLTSNLKRSFRNNSFNSNRSVIVSRNHQLKCLKTTFSLKSKRLSFKGGKKWPNSYASEPLSCGFRTTPGLLLKDENEGSVYENLNNTFLAKRQLVAREIDVARIQEAMVHQEEEICRIQMQINSLSIPQTSQSSQKTRNGTEEVSLLSKLERELITAKTQYDIFEDRLREFKHKATIARLQMETNIHKCLGK